MNTRQALAGGDWNVARDAARCLASLVAITLTFGLLACGSGAGFEASSTSDPSPQSPVIPPHAPIVPPQPPAAVPLAITALNLPVALQHAPYAAAIDATGGVAPYSWSIVNGGLPVGMAMTQGTGPLPAGVSTRIWLEGAPAAAGDFDFRVRVSDGNGALAESGLMLTVSAAPSPPPPVLPGWYDSAWLYRRTLTVPAGSTGADLDDFPLFIDATLPEWRDLANGGNAALASGDDFVFVASDQLTRLDHEIVSYDCANGRLATWVRLPVLAAASTTEIGVYYGNAQAVPQANPAGVWGTDHVAVLHLDRQSANGAPLGLADSSAMGNHGMPLWFGSDAGSRTGAPGIVGGCIELDGIDDAVMIAHSPSLSTPEGTWSLWLKTDGDWDTNNESGGYATRGTACVLARHLNSSEAGAMIGIVPTQSGKFYIKVNIDNDPALTFGGAPSVANGAWHHVALVFTQTVGAAARIYVDGIERHGLTLGEAWSFYDSLLWIGKSPDRYWEEFKGAVDEVHVSSVQRSADWILAGYNNQRDAAAFASIGAETPRP